MIFIGEWCGATASDAFFAAAQVVEAPDFQEAVRNFKSLYGIRDYPYLLR
jgi:hypothetical protein